MVLYQWGGEGHYGVVVKAGKAIHIFNPYNAKIDRYSRKQFNDRWYDKPEVKWALIIQEPSDL
jgi:ABC-type bacteriocin/lantibiotic exporter with double-glycine peptidase domain